jgi:DNA repair and recombination protein RAD52
MAAVGGGALRGDDGASGGGVMTLSSEQVGLLNAPLTRDQVATRQAGKGRQVAYLEGFEAIRQANRIFGHGGWGMTVDDLQFQAMSSGGFYRATVTVTVAGCEPQQDVGGCVAQNDTADQHDMAFKGAVTDAMKRALRHYGAAFGNDLYSDDTPAPAAAQSQQTTRQPAQRTVTVHEPTGQPQTNDQAADAALTTMQKRLHAMAQADKEGQAELLHYLKEQGKTRISELDMAAVTEWLLYFNDRAVMPDTAEVGARA